MAKKKAKKEEAELPEEDPAEDGETEGEGGEAAPKPRFSRKMIIIAAGGAGALLIAIVAAVFLLFGGEEEPAPDGQDGMEAAEQAPPKPPPPPIKAAFFDLPDIIVNVQTPDGSPSYLKLSVALELEEADDKVAIEPILPRIIDQFQTYLRELRLEDIRGSAGVMRLKEELLRRVSLAAQPVPVRDVLLKEMIVQ